MSCSLGRIRLIETKEALRISLLGEGLRPRRKGWQTGRPRRLGEVLRKDPRRVEGWVGLNRFTERSRKYE